MKVYNKRYNKRNRAQRYAYQKKYSQRPNAKAYSKKYFKNWRIENRERYNELLRQASMRRRARIARVAFDGSITTQALYTRDKGICGICDTLVGTNERSVDHVIPISKGGAHMWSNVQLAHLNCNLRKGVKLDFKISVDF